MFRRASVLIRSRELWSNCNYHHAMFQNIMSLLLFSIIQCVVHSIDIIISALEKGKSRTIFHDTCYHRSDLERYHFARL